MTRLELVEGWRDWWRWASVHLAAFASACVAVIVAVPEALTYALNVLPPEIRAWLAPTVGLATFALIVATRIFCKPKKPVDVAVVEDRTGAS